VVAVLWEHGYWGNNSARLASGIINAFVTKQRKLNNNIKVAEAAPAPVSAQAATSKEDSPKSSQAEVSN
jgi:penicillin-binding protein 2